MAAKKRKAASLSPEEEARRARQRELQAVAMKLKESGQTYKRRKHAKAHDRAHGKLKKGRAGADRKTDKAHKPRRAPQVIIVPIFWNTREPEKAMVLKAADATHAAISEAGYKVGLDTTNQHTPGQKFRYWEERGVKYRIELGPQEAQAGQTVLAICGTPGEVAKKQTINSTSTLIAKLHELLGNGKPSSATQDTKGAPARPATGPTKGPAQGPAAPAKRHKRFLDEQEDVENGGNGAAAGADGTEGNDVGIGGIKAKKSKKGAEKRSVGEVADGADRQTDGHVTDASKGAEVEVQYGKQTEKEVASSSDVGNAKDAGHQHAVKVGTEKTPFVVDAAKWGGGDDAEDDFGFDLLAAGEPENGDRKKKKHKGKLQWPQLAGHLDGGEQDVGNTGNGNGKRSGNEGKAAKGKKKQKVVVF